MRHDQNRFEALQRANCTHDFGFCFNVEAARCFVKHQNLRLVIKRAGDADALALTTRNANAALADD